MKNHFHKYSNYKQYSLPGAIIIECELLTFVCYHSGSAASDDKHVGSTHWTEDRGVSRHQALHTWTHSGQDCRAFRAGAYGSQGTVSTGK